MAGQGGTIRKVAARLTGSGWVVVYICVPNTPHLGVVPIPTKGGSGKQRYPDIVAYRGTITRLVEVEMTLDDRVACDISERFGEYVGALRDAEQWRTWRNHVKSQTGHTLPEHFHPCCDLVVCRNVKAHEQQCAARLRLLGIGVSSAASFEA